MSDTDSAPSTSSSSEPATGRVAENASQGFKEMPPQSAPPRERKELSAREAGKELADRRSVDNWGRPKEEAAADPVFYTGKDGDRAPANEAITLERAADDLAAWRQGQSDKAGLGEAIETERAVDKLRRDEGITPEEPNQPQLEQATINNEPSVPGLDPEVDRAMRLPQVRQAIEQEFEKVTVAETEFRTGIETAHRVSVASFVSLFPELAAVPENQFVPAMQRLAHTNPQRYRDAMGVLERAAVIENVRMQNQQREAHVQRQNFEREARQHDLAFDRLVGPQTPAQKQAFQKEAVAYAREFGISQAQLVHLMQNNPIMRHAAFQHMIHTAVTARLAKREAANYRQKLAPATLPHVNKPGHGGAVASRGQSDLAALNAALNKSNSVADAAKLLIARRKGR